MKDPSLDRAFRDVAYAVPIGEEKAVALSLIDVTDSKGSATDSDSQL